jgi:hypothetical protein
MPTNNTSRVPGLQAGADAGALNLPATPAPLLSPARPAPAFVKVKDVRDAPLPMSCQQTLMLSFFFDGTGNNLDADVGSWEHSNVARLYRSHLDNDIAKGIYRFYLPGIGTLFKDREVNDPGGTISGLAFGGQGQDRLDWAFARMKETITAAQARAQNPTNKICWIKVAVFGFSRGAALARAFCRDLQNKCEADAGSATGWRWKAGKYPIEITFLGLFDTVASRGLPPSANNFRRNHYVRALEQYAKVLSWINPVVKLATPGQETPELKRLAFGQPGADPAPGPEHGHATWAAGMSIVSMVKRCVHMMAAHENRNSFALDSTLYEASPNRFAFPESTTEMIYPGVHSDVGGGYRPGEQGSKTEQGAQLSLIPLRAMYAEAIKVVPLVPFQALKKAEREDFAIDTEGSKHYAQMLALFTHYLAAVRGVSVAGATQGEGGEFNRHMQLYYAWRFYAINTKGSSVRQAQQQKVEDHEKEFAKSRAGLAMDRKTTRAELHQAQRAEEVARLQLDGAKMAKTRFGSPIDPSLESRLTAAKNAAKDKQTADDRVRARQEGAANDSGLNANADKYDEMLRSDAKQIVAWMREDKTLTLRPHYAALVSAYLNEYESGKGLRDAKIIALFDDYVHNSMAGFAKDESWPSDPRILYVGGDKKLRYASLSPDQGQNSGMAAA